MKSLKKKLTIVTVFAAALMVFALLPAAAYARDVKVFFDGKEVRYDVPAQIIADYTMVPLSQTFEALVGMGTIYDPATRTSTFYANNHKNEHTIGTNIVYVDGIAVAYSTPSVIIDGRALVPIRMITDTSGLKVDWDPVNYHVLITTPNKPAPQTPAPAQPTATPASVHPSIIHSAAADKTSVSNGSPVVITVKTSSGVNNVWAKCDNAEVNATLKSTEQNGIKTWSLTIYPAVTQQVQVFANSDKTQTAAVNKAINVNVASAQIQSVTASKTSVGSGEAITLSIRTNREATNCWVEANGVTMAASPTGNDNQGNIWTFTFNPYYTQQIRISANSTQTLTNAATYQMNVMVTEVRPSITGVYANPTTISSGEYSTITVSTNNAASYVWIETDMGVINCRLTNNDAYGNKIWTGSYYAGGGGTFAVYAGRTSGSRDASSSVNVSVRVLENVAIVSANVSPGYVTMDYSYVDNYFSITTTAAATYVQIETRDGYVYPATYNGTMGGYKDWSVDAALCWSGYSTNSEQVYITASGQSGSHDRYTIKLNVEGRIYY